VGADPESGSVAVPLAPGVEAHVGIKDLDGDVELGIRHKDELVERKVIAPDDPPKPFKLELGPLEIDLWLGADNAEGSVEAKGHVKRRDDGEWKTIADLDKTILRYAPAHGSVGGNSKPDPLVFKDSRFGESRMSSKNVTRMFVEDNERLLADVGRHVKKDLWGDYPDWVFNTVACVGAFDGEGRGSYTDPTSIWFNVFLGYYQIDAPKPDWTRPFAYEAADGAAAKIRFDEVVRLGKSDWNYFSNWMYGVPAESIEPHNVVEMSKVRAAQADAGVIGSGSWHRVSIQGVDFVSAYEASHPGAIDLVRNSLLSGLWRKAFGQPNPRPEHTESFVGTTMDAELYVSYWEDEEAFHTVIFGGTGPSGGDPGFLAGQLEAAAAVIARSYPNLGFAPVS
jgi:hypothetical protein